MISFGPKDQEEQYPHWVDFSSRLAPDATLDDGTVAIRVSSDSDEADAAPGDMLVGEASVNVADFQYETETGEIATVPAGKGLFITVGGGVSNCTYVLRFKANRSGGDVLVQSVKLRVQADV